MIPIFIILYRTPKIEEKCISTVKKYTDLNKADIQIIDNSVENRNLAIVWNESIERYTGWNSEKDKIAVLLNTDCFVTHNWLEKLERVMKTSDQIGFTGPMTDHCGTKQKGTNRL